MTDKQRALPSWMAKKEERVKEKQLMKSRRKRKAARTVFYCMNEKELVEAALSCLTDGGREDALLRTHQQVKEKDTTQKRDDPNIPPRAAKVLTQSSEDSTDCSEDLDATYVSETDLDITEQETLPHTDSFHHPEPQGPRSGPAQGQRAGLAPGPSEQMNTDVQSEDRNQQPKTPPSAAKDDDALRLLREIFFT